MASYRSGYHSPRKRRHIAQNPVMKQEQLHETTTCSTTAGLEIIGYRFITNTILIIYAARSPFSKLNLASHERNHVHVCVEHVIQGQTYVPYSGNSLTNGTR